MFIEIIVGIIIAILSYWFYCFNSFYKHLKCLPSPRVWPIVGSWFELEPDSIDVLKTQMKILNSKTIRVHLGFRTMLMTSDYNMTEFVLNSPLTINKSISYKIAKGWLGESLFTSSGKHWQKQRKMLTPGFHFQILEQFIDVFNLNGQILVKKLKNKIGNSSVNVLPMISLYTLDVICETAMGSSINAQLEETSDYIESITTMLEIFQARFGNPLYHSDFLYKLSPLYQKEKASLKIINEVTYSVLHSKRDQLKKNSSSSKNDTDVDDFGQKKKVPFLDILLQSTLDGKPLTDKEICDEVSTFMVGGYDTTAIALSLALYSLANNPEIQQKAYEEIESIFGDDKERPCTCQDVQQMKYLELVIKETLRMYPSLPVIAREVSADIKYDNFIIPKSTTINVAIYAIHHDPDYFPEPHKFDPERFTPENCNGRRPYTYIPFSAGPRNCIGQKFANLGMKTALSRILRHFQLKPATPKHDLKLRATILIKALDGVKISLQERK